MQSPQRKLKVRLLIVQLISIIPFLLFIFYLFDLWYDTRRSQVLEQSINQAKLIAAFMHNNFLSAQETANVVANDKNLYKLLTTDKAASRQIIQNIVDQTQEIDNIAITDSTGIPIISSVSLSDQQLKEITFADRDYFQQVLLTKKPAFSPTPLIGRLTKKSILTIASPMLRENEVTFVVVVAMDINRLKEKLDQFLPEDANNLIYVLDKERQIVFLGKHPLPSESEKSLLANLPFIKKAQTDKLAIIENQVIPLPKDKSVIGGAVSVSNSGWVVVSVESVENIFAPLFRVQNLVWLIIFSALLFSLSTISYFLRKVKIVF